MRKLLSQKPTAARILLVAAIWTAQAPAQGQSTHAEPPPAQTPAGVEPAGYREVIDQAVVEFSEGNWDEARALFARAYALFPNARSARGLGLVEFERRNYGECIRYLEEALTSAIRPLDASQREEAQKLLTRARGFVARVSLDVAPATAEVLVDGVPVGVEPGGVLTLQVGDHIIEVHADNFRTEKRPLSVRGGEEQKLVVVLKQRDTTALPSAVTAPASPAMAEPAPSDRKPLYKNAWLWTAVAVVGAGAALGVVLMLRPESETRIEAAMSPNTPSGSTLQGLATW